MCSSSVRSAGADAGTEQRFEIRERDAPLRLIDGAVGAHDERGERRHVEDVGLGVPFRVQRQGDLVAVDQRVDGALRLVAEAHEHGASRALAHAGRRHTVFQPREAADAVLTGLAHGVEVDLLVRASLGTALRALAEILVAQHHAEIVALVHRAVRAGFDATRLGAEVTDAGHVEEVRVRILAGALVLVPVHRPLGLAGLRLQDAPAFRCRPTDGPPAS